MSSQTQSEPLVTGAITDGPDVWMLAAALFGGSRTTFTVNGEKIEVSITYAMMEGGSRTKWFVNGHTVSGGRSRMFRVYYNTTTRKGKDIAGLRQPPQSS